MLQLLFNFIQCDALRPLGIDFQDSAAPQMEGLVELHDHIVFYLVLILFGVSWILTSVIVNYVSIKSPLSYKWNESKIEYFLSTLEKWIYNIILPIACIYCFISGSEFHLDPEKDNGPLLLMANKTSSLTSQPFLYTAALIGGATICLIWGLNIADLLDIEWGQTVEIIQLNSENIEAEGLRLLNESGATRFGFQEGALTDTFTSFFIGIVRSSGEGFQGVLEVSRQVFTDSMTWLVTSRVVELIGSNDLWIEYTLVGGLCFQLSNFRVINILSPFFNTNINLGGIWAEMLHMFFRLVGEFTISGQYVYQPIFFASIHDIILFMSPASIVDFSLDIGNRFDYRVIWTHVSRIERQGLNNSRERFVEIFNGDVDEFYEHNPEEVEDYEDLYEDEDEEPPAK